MDASQEQAVLFLFRSSENGASECFNSGLQPQNELSLSGVILSGISAIAVALDLYFRGMSVRKVKDHFSQVHNLKVNHVTVYRWVARFGKIAAEWMDRQGARFWT